jgi:uncharacterized RDD family membrane protein YckC
MSEALDPYRAPSSPIQSADEDFLPPERLITAGKWRRFFTFVVDYIVRFVLIFLFAIPFGIFGGEAALQRMEKISRIEDVVLGMLSLLAYYLIFESLWARTPGKWILGTRVVDESGRKPGFRQVLGRTFTRIVPFEALSLLFADDADARGWHDSWPRTRVVLTRVTRTIPPT